MELYFAFLRNSAARKFGYIPWEDQKVVEPQNLAGSTIAHQPRSPFVASALRALKSKINE